MRPLESLDTDAVDNVYVFLADALRFDELPESVAELGISFKGVAHALVTPQCVPSIVSGKLPPEHGVTWFHHAIGADTRTVFDFEGFDTGYSELVWSGHAVRDVLGDPRDAGLEDVDEPFVVVEHDNGGHAPYSGMRDLRPKDMYRQFSTRDEILKNYRITVSESVNRFRERLEVLRMRGCLENTLVVFMADHGELLGEHGGFVGHGLPMAPEIVYVPMVFIHPSLPAGETGHHLLQQIDVYPTIADSLGLTPDTSGAILTERVEPDRPIFSQGIMHPPLKYRGTYLDPGYDARGMWTDQGGHVFVRNPKPVRMVTAAYEATRSGYTAAYNSHRNVLRRLKMTATHYMKDYQKYGSPSIGYEEARDRTEDVRMVTENRSERELSDATTQQLEDLGYH